MYEGKLEGKLQRKALAFVALFVILAIVVGSSRAGLAKARRPEKAFDKYYESIQIQRGDTLWSIASANRNSECNDLREYIKEIRMLNHICGDEIYAGEYLMIPRYYDISFY